MYSKKDIMHVHNSGLYRDVCTLERLKWLATTQSENSLFTLDEILLEEEKLKINPFYNCAKAQYCNNKKRKTRYRKWIRSCLYSGFRLAFVTITFSDDIFLNVSYAVRRRYVAYWLKGFKGIESYIANVDFGITTEREHYHALVCLNDNFDMSIFQKKGGKMMSRDLTFNFSRYSSFARFELVRLDYQESDILALSAYCNKLANHGLKDSGKSIKPIFSRKTT